VMSNSNWTKVVRDVFECFHTENCVTNFSVKDFLVLLVAAFMTISIFCIIQSMSTSIKRLRKKPLKIERDETRKSTVLLRYASLTLSGFSLYYYYLLISGIIPSDPDPANLSYVCSILSLSMILNYFLLKYDWLRFKKLCKRSNKM
jgi:hypothetical protein